MIVVLSGPSGVSKSYLCWEVIADFPGFYLPKKHTTRKKRPGENEREYYFVSKEEFNTLQDRHAFEIFTNIYGNSYAVTGKELEPAKEGQKDAILVLDTFIAQEQRKRLSDLVLVYILPTEKDVLAKYIVERGDKYNENPEQRLALLDEELEQWGNFDYVIPFINSEIAYQFLRNIIISEKCRPQRFAPEMDLHRFLQFRSFPRIAVDVVFFNSQFDRVALIERWKEPLGWAIPGGFVMYGESVEAAADREAFEEVGVHPQSLQFVGVFSDPSRDPRMHVISVAYCTKIDALGSPSGDARNAMWFPLSNLPKNIVFDHKHIIESALSKATRPY